MNERQKQLFTYRSLGVNTKQTAKHNNMSEQAVKFHGTIILKALGKKTISEAQGHMLIGVIEKLKNQYGFKNSDIENILGLEYDNIEKVLTSMGHHLTDPHMVFLSRGQA